MMDYKDLAIETLSDSEAELLEHNASLRADVASYRLVLVETLHTLHFVTRQRDRLREQIRVWLNVSQDEVPS